MTSVDNPGSGWLKIKGLSYSFALQSTRVFNVTHESPGFLKFKGSAPDNAASSVLD